MFNFLLVCCVVVLGVGVMGVQIVVYFINVGVDIVLFDLFVKEGLVDGIVLKVIVNLGKLSFVLLVSKLLVEVIILVNYEFGLEQLKDCDLIIEVIVECMDWKQDLYKKIVLFVVDYVVLVFNILGLGINKLVDVLFEQLCYCFCGVYFFNLLCYMYLVELILVIIIDVVVLEGLEVFLVIILGKGVVYVKDILNFIGNCIGVFLILLIIYYIQQFGLGFDEVDGLIGLLVGCLKLVIYCIFDVVGLDIMVYVIKIMGDILLNDLWYEFFKLLKWLDVLIVKGVLGQKIGVGIFCKVGKDIVVLDLEKQDYCLVDCIVVLEVVEILKIKNLVEKFVKLCESQYLQVQFLWVIFCDLFYYSVYYLVDIVEIVCDVDLVICWGYGWLLGLFEIWQVVGWKQVVQWIVDDIVVGKSMSSVLLLDWVFDGCDGVYVVEGSYSLLCNVKLLCLLLLVYQCQCFLDLLLGEQFVLGEIVFENDGLCMWYDGDGIVVVSFKIKMNIVFDQVLDGLQECVSCVEKDFQGLVIWQQKEFFFVGVDLVGVLGLLQVGKVDQFEEMVVNFQCISQCIKYLLVLVVVVVCGLVLGGGCEFQMYSVKIVVFLESYIGLVEVGVGLLLVGGGLKELVVCVLQVVGLGGDVFVELKKIFEIVVMVKVFNLVVNVKELGLLCSIDKVVFNSYEVLYIVKVEVCVLVEVGYCLLLLVCCIQVVGDVGIVIFKMMLVNMLEGCFISLYDYEIVECIVIVLCGGKVDRGILVDEEWLLILECKYFVELVQQEKIQVCIVYMFKIGKLLWN